MICARVLTVVVSVAALAGVAASIAPATIYNPGHVYRNATGTFAGTQRTDHTFAITDAGGGAALLDCTTATFNGTKPIINGVLGLGFTPAFSGCALQVSGTWHQASPSSTCAWAINGGSYDDTTGGMTGSFTDCTTVRFYVPDFTCTLVFSSYQTFSSNPYTQDRDAFDTSNSSHTFAGGMRVTFTNVPLDSTSNCPGTLQSPSAGSYSGTEFIPGVWVGP
ncbi:MAG TPA: hypothetical protein VGM33_02685 [Baekduia sp.]